MRETLRMSKPIKKCQICNAEIITTKKPKKFCSRDCLKIHNQTDVQRQVFKMNGRKGGKQSATSQPRRSKNEVLFADMCIDHFGKENILCNSPMFDGWDADVIIPFKKVAVMWNGVWHYKQITNFQSLNQIQSRDNIKTAIIEKYGYTPYVIKDMGKHNPKFVQQEFACFILSLIDL